MRPVDLVKEYISHKPPEYYHFLNFIRLSQVGMHGSEIVKKLSFVDGVAIDRPVEIEMREISNVLEKAGLITPLNPHSHAFHFRLSDAGCNQASQFVNIPKVASTAKAANRKKARRTTTCSGKRRIARQNKTLARSQKKQSRKMKRRATGGWKYDPHSIECSSIEITFDQYFTLEWLKEQGLHLLIVLEELWFLELIGEASTTRAILDALLGRILHLKLKDFDINQRTIHRSQLVSMLRSLSTKVDPLIEVDSYSDSKRLPTQFFLTHLGYETLHRHAHYLNLDPMMLKKSMERYEPLY